MTRQSKIAVFQPVFQLFCAATAFSGPVTTVPWNGHTGAISFTYDDARQSQLPNLLPQLDSLKLHATFFVASSGTGGNFEEKKSDWMKVAQNGHEIANHTRKHGNVPADPQAAAIVSDFATYLRGLDPHIEATSFAYPNCSVNGKAGVGSESFIARGCGGTRNAWDKEPSDWMNIVGVILTPTSENSAVTALNSAKSENSWSVMLSHEVAPNPDIYSVTPQTNLKLLTTAISNNLWIETYSTIGAYYRAHFTLDAAAATSNANGWSMAWTSPHPKLPKKVMLRVKLAAATFGTGFTVQQGGVTIPAESDGSYVIDFMKLSLTVLKSGVSAVSGAFLPERLKVRATPAGIGYAGVIGEPVATVADIRGSRLFHGKVRNGLVPLRPGQMRGVLFLTLADPITGKSVRALINPAR